MNEVLRFFFIFLKLKPVFRYRNNPLYLHGYLSEITYTIAQKPKKLLNKVHDGFTLIELLVTLCVLGLMIVIAIPSLRTMLSNNRLTAHTDSLVNALSYARGIALNNNSNVQICPLDTPNSTTCGNNWTNGWIVITQPTTGTPTLLKSQQNNSTIGPTIGANVNSVTFSAKGLASAQSNFTLCDDRGATYARSVEVMATGFIQSGSTVGQAVWNNASLTCP